ncbi:MAG TPA: MFS transporter [Verrucomicrobiae bacterium]|nr:MFS transporter [Verrucomicrobiae bacterium]
MTSIKSESSSLKAELNFGYIWLISIVAAPGGLLFGWDWVVIGGAKPFFEKYFHLTTAAQSTWANSCALIGCLVGALVAAVLSDKLGRKRPLIVSAFLFAITSLGNAFAPTFSIFISWRMLSGVAIGLASNLSPMYISEIATAQMRGRLVSINQLIIVIGTAFNEYHSTGKPPICALVLDWPANPKVRQIDDEFMFGDSVLVAPMFAGETNRLVYLPGGNWYDSYPANVLAAAFNKP